MVRIKRWVIGKRKKVIWSEPQLPPFVKINPDSPPGLGGGLQPGDISMGAAAEEFLKMREDEGEGEPVLPALQVSCARMASSASMMLSTEFA
jgi:hypothetical protein